MKKGFTLIELLAVVVILSMIAVITMPAVNNIIMNAKVSAYNQNIEAIKRAAYDWGLKNSRSLPTNEGESVLVYLNELKLHTNIDVNIKNPYSGKVISNNTSVTITRSGSKYEYTVNLIEVEKENTDNAPLLVISGNLIDYVEVNQNGTQYSMPTTTPKTSSGQTINNAYVSYQVLKDGKEVGSVDTSSVGIYKILYSVTYDGETGTYEKTVVVRDTTKPTLDVGANINCTVATIPTNLLDGVTVTDNSGEIITPKVESGIQNKAGTYYVTYTATDSSGNSNTKRKTVTVS